MLPHASHFKYTPCHRVQTCHQLEVHNASQRHQRRTEQQQRQATSVLCKRIWWSLDVKFPRHVTPILIRHSTSPPSSGVKYTLTAILSVRCGHRVVVRQSYNGRAMRVRGRRTRCPQASVRPGTCLSVSGLGTRPGTSRHRPHSPPCQLRPPFDGPTHDHYHYDFLRAHIARRPRANRQLSSSACRSRSFATLLAVNRVSASRELKRQHRPGNIL